MLDLLSKSDKINIADKKCYVNQIKNKSGEFSEERLAFGTSYQPSLALRLFLGGKMKRCFKCKKIKSLSNFHKDRSKKNNHSSYCKKCEKPCSKESYLRNKKKYGGLYSLWITMIRRCYDSNTKGYRWYGGRNITVCEKWKDDFSIFYEWAKDKRRKGLQIDRIDNNGNYTPENCRFVTRTENIRNSSATKLNVVEVKKIKVLLKEGELTQREIGKLFNVSEGIIQRIKSRKTWADVKIDVGEGTRDEAISELKKIWGWRDENI